MYTGTLTLNPLADQDDSTIVCTGRVTGETEIQRDSSSGELYINVTGRCSIWVYCVSTDLSLSSDLPDPVVTIPDASTTGGVGDQLQLNCTVTTVDHLTPSAVLTVQWSGGSVGGSGVMESETVVTGTTSVRTLTFSSLNTSHGAEYSCQAAINIPDINLMKTGSDRTEVKVQSEDIENIRYTWYSICVFLPQSKCQW